MLAYLSSIGYTVYGASSTGTSALARNSDGYSHLVVPLSRRFSPLADIKAFWVLLRILSRGGFQIVHTHTPKANLLGQWAAFFARIPVRVATVHGLYFTPDSNLLRRLVFAVIEAVTLLPAGLVFLVNKNDVAAVKKYHLCKVSKICLLPGGMGINLIRFSRPQLSEEQIAERRAALGIEHNAFVIGYIGRLVEEKGVLELLHAFKALSRRHENVVLLMIGPCDSAKRDAVSPAIAEELGIGDRCRFLGQRDDTEYLYSIMDLFVLPSHREGLPLVLMEAQAMGVPVITTDARGCSEAVLDGETGIMVPVRDTDELAKAIEYLVIDPGLRQQMGARARGFAERRFNEQVVFELTDALYKNLLAVRAAAVSQTPRN
jgi:glycosyltransferase involved in cell wall biosynthesis